MSWTHRQRISAIAIVVMVAAVPVLWQIADVRAAQATEHKQNDLVNTTVAVGHTTTTTDYGGDGHTTNTSNDYDGDGIADATDACPTRPETNNGFQDGDGCPDVVTTTGAS